MPYGKPPTKKEMSAYRKAQKAVGGNVTKLNAVQSAFRQKHDYKGWKAKIPAKPKPPPIPANKKGKKIKKMVPAIKVVKGTKKSIDLAPTDKPAKKAKKAKITFDDLYGGGNNTPSGIYINEMTSDMSFAKARAKVRKLLTVYNKTDSPTLSGAYAYIKEMKA